MGYVPILAIIVCLVLCTPAVHAEGPPPAPPPVPPQPEDPVCWRVSPECASRSVRWGEGRDRRFYLDITNVCKDTLYMFACLEILRDVGDENRTCIQLFLGPGESTSVEAYRIEEPTERYRIKVFGTKDKEVFKRVRGTFDRCISLVPSFFDARF